MAQTGKNIVITVLCVILMCAAVMSAVLYAEGYYDISFIDRDVPDDGEKTPPETEGSIPNESDTSVPEDDVTEDKINIPDAGGYLAEGYGVSGEMYDKDVHIIAKLSLELPHNYTSGTIVKPYTSVTLGRDGVQREYLYMKTEQDLYSAELYMGYIIVTENGISSVYTPTLEKILEVPKTSLGELVYMTDKSGAPVFEKDGEFFKIENKTLVKTEKYDTGLYFNRTESPRDIYAVNGTGGVVYKSSDGEVLFKADGEYGYGFSEGFGMTYDGDDAYFYNEDGKMKIDDFFKVGKRDIYAKGAIYFDSGYVMVRNIVINHKNKVTEDYETLINTSGREYTLPFNTTLISYSNQRLLLERDGKYGFYALKNDWITDIEYTYATPFCEGLAVVGDKNGKKGVIDVHGNTVVGFEYTHITECAGGIFLAYSETDGWCAFAKLS